MPQFFRLANPDVTSVSVDGVEHKVNPDGLLEVHAITSGLPAVLKQHNAKPTNSSGKSTVSPPTPVEQSGTTLTPAETAERDALFLKLDKLRGTRTDRRRSLSQLREMYISDLEERTAGRDDPGSKDRPNAPARGAPFEGSQGAQGASG